MRSTALATSPTGMPGLCQGAGEPVTPADAGTGDVAFTGGTINDVIVDVSGDVEMEEIAMFARD